MKHLNGPRDFVVNGDKIRKCFKLFSVRQNKDVQIPYRVMNLECVTSARGSKNLTPSNILTSLGSYSDRLVLG